MKITVDLDKSTVVQLRREAARQKRSMSELVEDALRPMFRPQLRPGRLPTLPRFSSGGLLVDVADREALYNAMEGPSYFEKLYGPVRPPHSKNETK